MCADQPFFSSQDWFVGTLPIEHGGARGGARRSSGASATTTSESLRARPRRSRAGRLRHPGGRHGAGRARARASSRASAALCDRHGTVLVFDETITGFRWSAGGAQARVRRHAGPVTWGKAMGNGFPIAALAGQAGADGARRPAHRPAAGRSCCPARTGRRRGLAAFRAVVRGLPAETDPIAAMERQGRALADGVNAAAAEAGIAEHLSVRRPARRAWSSAPPTPTGSPSQAMRTLFLQEILRGAACSASRT